MHTNQNYTLNLPTFACILIATTITGCSTFSPDRNPVLEELKGIRASLDQLNQNLTKQTEKREKVLSASNNQSSFNNRGANVEKLLGINLPDDPTTKDVKLYIQKIKTATEGQRSYSHNDPQVVMYMEVGKENIPELINALSVGGSHSSANYHLLPAIEKLMSESDKAIILESLSKHPYLIRVITNNGWEEDARDTLLHELKSESRLSTDWVRAVAALREPESYPLLRQYFISADSRYQTYDAIKDLPIEDLKGAVNEAWIEGRYGHEYSRQRLADIAVTYGNLEALEYLIHALNFPSSNSSYARLNTTSRFIVLGLLDTKRSNEELATWFATNKEQIKFDTETGRFIAENDPIHASDKTGESPVLTQDAPDIVWIENVEQAKAEAIEKDLPILLLYTATSWCGYCRKLDDQLLTQDEFKAYASENLVLLLSDHSDREKGKKWKEKNKELLESCPVGGFPHMYLLTSDAKKLGSVQYYEPKWSIQDYLDKIESLKGDK